MTPLLLCWSHSDAILETLANNFREESLQAQQKLADREQKMSDIPLVVTKKPTIGDYFRTGSCTGEPKVLTEDCNLE